MLRRILSTIALLAFLTRSIVGWAATIAGDEHVSISESVPSLQFGDAVQVRTALRKERLDFMDAGVQPDQQSLPTWRCKL